MILILNARVFIFYDGLLDTCSYQNLTIDHSDYNIFLKVNSVIVMISIQILTICLISYVDI